MRHGSPVNSDSKFHYGDTAKKYSIARNLLRGSASFRRLNFAIPPKVSFMRIRIITVTILCVTAFFAPNSSRAQHRGKTTVETSQLSVFLDCDRCDYAYILSQIDFVNYVRDRSDANVHLLITRQATGSGSRYTLNFIGLNDLSALRDTLYYSSSNTDTGNERRIGLNQVLKIGLVRYIARTRFADRLVIGYNKPTASDNVVEQPKDNWNAWVFGISTSGSFNSEEARESASLRTAISANRVTEEWKIRTNINGNFSRNRYNLADTTIISTNRNGSIFNFTAKSMGEHWSVGSSTSLSTSSFNNTDLAVSVAPGVEYSIFPYSQFSRREFRIEYRPGLSAYDYTETTIFDKNAETLIFHELESTFELRQPWGSSNMSLNASQFLYDFSESRAEYFRVRFRGGVSVRVVRGLAVSFNGHISWVKDQLSLPKAEASEEDILLGAKSLPTAYQYGMSLGLSYTFGSIYNNVVNPRFGF